MHPVLIVKAWQYEAELTFPHFLGIGGAVGSGSAGQAMHTVELNFLSQVMPALMLVVGMLALCSRQLFRGKQRVGGGHSAPSYPRVPKASPRSSDACAPAIAPSEEAISLLDHGFMQSDGAPYAPACAPSCASSFAPSTATCQPSKAQAVEMPMEAEAEDGRRSHGAPLPYGVAQPPAQSMAIQQTASNKPRPAQPAARVAQSPAAALRAEINQAFAPKSAQSPAAALRAEINKAFAPNAPLPTHLQVDIPGSFVGSAMAQTGWNPQNLPGSGGSPSGGFTTSFGQYSPYSLGPHGYIPPQQRSPQQASPILVKVKTSPSPPIPPSPPLDLRGLSRMEDFIAEAKAGTPVAEEVATGRGLVNSARNFAKNITQRVLPKRGFVKGVAERWTEAHLTPPQPPRSVSGFEPYSPEKLSISKLNVGEVAHSPERVGPSSFERRRRIIEERILNA